MNSLQNKWDKWLIKGWYGFKTFGWVVGNFYREQLGDGERLPSIVDGVEKLKTLNLKRCTFPISNGHLMVPMYNLDVRAYIDQRSPTMSACLITDKMNRIEILLDIDSFPWRYKKIKGASAKKERNKRRGRVRSGVNYRVRTRDNDKRYSWNTVK